MTGMRYSDPANSLQTEFDAEIAANPPVIEWVFDKHRRVLVGHVIDDPYRDGAYNGSKTHCKRGHPLDQQNTMADHGYRRCRTCKNERRRAS
jgi:hypothetical protein